MDPLLKNLSRGLWALMFCVLAAFTALDVYPNVSEILRLRSKLRMTENRQKIMSPEEKLKRENKAREEKAALEKDYLFIKEAVSAADDKIRQKKSVPNIILELEDTAASSGVDLTLIKPSNVKSSGGYLELPVELGVECDFNGLVAFLSGIEESPTMISLKSLAVNKKKGMPSRLGARVSLLILFDEQIQNE